MKVGDKLVVKIDNFDVCYATVEHIEDDKVSLVIPQTRVVMGLATSLAAVEPEKEHILSNEVITNE